MKKLFLLVLAVCFALRALSHTESEMLDAARNMALELKGSSMYCVKGESEKLCTEVKAGTSADVSIRALRGSGGLESP